MNSPTAKSALCLCALTLVPMTAHAQGLDGCGTGIGLDVGQHAAAVADLNHDGILDVVVDGAVGWVQVRTGGPYVSILGFADYALHYSDRVPVSPESVRQIEVHDLNGDGDPDLLVVTRQGLTVALGVGDGTFTHPRSLECDGGSLGCSAEVGDLDGDGDLDLLVHETGTKFLLNDGTAQFEPGRP